MFGHKTIAWLDVWSIQHILLGIAVAATTQRLSRYERITAAFVAVYGWELVEYLAEIGHMGRVVQAWLQGQELWYNRFVADPVLALGIGYGLGKNFPWLHLPAMLASFWWWFFHLAVFPHCMYVQTAEAWNNGWVWFFFVTYLMAFAVNGWLSQAAYMPERRVA